MILVVINTNNLKMYDNVLDPTKWVFALVGGIDYETEKFSVYSSIHSLAEQPKYRYLYGQLSRLEKQFPDWRQFIADGKAAYYSNDDGGFLVIRS